MENNRGKIKIATLALTAGFVALRKTPMGNHPKRFVCKKIGNLAFIIMWSVGVLFFFNSCSVDSEVYFYISPEGNDQNKGSIDAPFSSIERAQKEIRRLHKEQNQIKVNVVLRKGNYTLTETLMFNEEDSGTENAPVSFHAFPGEEVIFFGGCIINNFVPLSDEGVKARINSEYHSKIWQADLRSLGIKDVKTAKPTGYGRKMQASGLELFFNGQPMTLARYPNEGEWMRIVSVPQSGDSLWNKGSEQFKRFGIAIGRHYGKFQYEGDRPLKWAGNDNIWLHGYWSWDWADSYVKVKHINTKDNEFELEEPHGSYGYTKGQRYYARNILEELDSPGEWYLDQVSGVLYFWPPSPIKEGEAVVSVMEEVMLRINNANHIKFEGISFECSRGEAVKIEGGSHNLIAGCNIRNMGSNAVIIDGGHHNGVSGCNIYNIGDCGIIINGGDRKTLVGADNFATNNHIHHYSRINRTYRPAVRLDGVGNLLAHNHIHDSPHVAVLFNGNNHILEYNEIHDIAKETGDVGAFYIGRNWTERGHIIRYNYFHDLHGPGEQGVMGVYLDDTACGITVSGNVFYRAGRAVLVGGGDDNIITNNIFIDCNPSIEMDARGMTWGKSMYIKGNKEELKMKEKLKEVNFSQPPYSIQYPTLAKMPYKVTPGMPIGNEFCTNISYGGKWRIIDPYADEVVLKNNFVASEVPDYIDVKEGKLYPKDEEILNNMNFQKIPFKEIGLYKDKYRKNLP